MGFLARVSRRLRRSVPLGVEETYLYRLRASDPVVEVAAPSLEARLSLLEIEALSRLGEVGPYSHAQCIERLQRGDLCYCVWVADELAHYSWVQRSGLHPIQAADVVCTVRDGDFWIYNCRTAPRYRGHGLYTAVLRRIVDDHFHSGFRCAWVYTSHANVASQRGITRAGFGPDSTLRAGDAARARTRPRRA